MRNKSWLPDIIRLAMLFGAGVLVLSVIRYVAQVLMAVWA
jgi:hypothetical protein